MYINNRITYLWRDSQFNSLNKHILCYILYLLPFLCHYIIDFNVNSFYFFFYIFYNIQSENNTIHYTYYNMVISLLIYMYFFQNYNWCCKLQLLEFLFFFFLQLIVTQKNIYLHCLFKMVWSTVIQKMCNKKPIDKYIYNDYRMIIIIKWQKRYTQL